MAEMIERVARAIWRECKKEPFESTTDHDFDFALARAAIAAMREPTTNMIKVGEGTPIGHSWGSDGEFTYTPEAIWHAMIDAALAG